MRKIEEQMLRQIRAVLAKDYKGAMRCLGNTTVFADPREDGKPSARVLLHGSHIATVGEGVYGRYVTINLKGYNTPTTRSRLTAIVREFVPGALGVATKLGQVSIVARLAGNMVRVNIDSDGWYCVNTLLENHNAR